MTTEYRRPGISGWHDNDHAAWLNGQPVWCELGGEVDLSVALRGLARKREEGR